MTLISLFRGRATALALAVAFCMAAGVETTQAQDAAGGEGVVATIDGSAITEDDMAAAADEIGDEVGQMPGDPRSNLLDIIINFRLAARAAEAADMDKTPEARARLALVRDRALYLEYMRSKVAPALTEEAARQRFDEEVADFVPGDEIHAYHILVETEDEAKAVVADLDNGGDFEEIAKTKSIDPGSAPNGGDLDFIAPGDTVDSFEAAAFALAVGEYTETPVESPFGWHVIKIVEKRPQEPPTFEEEARRIQSDLFGENFDAAIDELRAAANIEIVPEPGMESPEGMGPMPVPAMPEPPVAEEPAPEPYQD